MRLRSYCCPECGRLCTVPWEAAWCHHAERADPTPPDSVETEWMRMLPVTNVDTGQLPPEADEWYVQECRNNYGYPNNEIPGEDKRTTKTVAGPLSREDAYAFAASAPRDDVPTHVHYFRVLPGDLL